MVMEVILSWTYVGLETRPIVGILTLLIFQGLRMCCCFGKLGALTV